MRNLSASITIESLNPAAVYEVWRWTVGTSGGWWVSNSCEHTGQWFLDSDISGFVARTADTDEPAHIFPAGFNPNR